MPDTTVPDTPMQAGVRVYGDQTLREVATDLARAGAAVATVIERADPRRVLGVISLAELLLARERDLREEELRERHLIVSFRKRG
jgi:hypothetical protein